MKPDLDFAYAQARIQARFAALPPEAEWERLTATRTLASFLEEARSWSFRDWVKGFSGQSDVHDLEAGLRTLFQENLEAVARWVPAPWHDAVSWVIWLARLRLLVHLQTGRKAPGWVARDASLRLMLDGEGGLDPRYLEDSGAQALVRPQDGLVEAWTLEWRSRWPARTKEATANLEAFRSLLENHFHVFRRAKPDSAWHLRKELRERLRLRFHRHTLEPVVPFIYLTLTALDLERLRGALISRALFSSQDEPTPPEIAARGAF